eukprot:2413528-Rhodomonas_salina.2
MMCCSAVLCELWAAGLEVGHGLDDTRAPWAVACTMFPDASEVGVHGERPTDHLHPSPLLSPGPGADAFGAGEEVVVCAVLQQEVTGHCGVLSGTFNCLLCRHRSPSTRDLNRLAGGDHGGRVVGVGG